MDKQREVWQILDSRSYGGAESHVKELACALSESGYKVRVVLLQSYGPHPMIDELLRLNVACTVIDGSIKSFIRTVKTFRPALLHTHGYKANLLVRLLSKYFQIPSVSTYHSGDRGKGRLWFYQCLDETTSFMGGRIAVDDGIKKRIPWDTKVIHNFVKIPKQINIKRKGSEYKVAFVGRLSQEKGVEQFCQLPDKLPHCRFEIFGGGDLYQGLVEKYAGKIKFHHAVSSMDNYWREFDLLCMPSQYEGMPMVALEALSNKVPVVAYAVGGLNSIIVHEKNGYLIKPNYLEGLATQIDAHYNLSEAEKSSLQEHAFETVKLHFSPEVVMPKIISFYESILK